MYLSISPIIDSILVPFEDDHDGIYILFCIFKLYFCFFALWMYLVLIEVARGFCNADAQKQLQKLNDRLFQDPVLPSFHDAKIAQADEAIEY